MSIPNFCPDKMICHLRIKASKLYLRYRMLFLFPLFSYFGRWMSISECLDEQCRQSDSLGGRKCIDSFVDRKL
jgi:hypothetical protein